MGRYANLIMKPVSGIKACFNAVNQLEQSILLTGPLQFPIMVQNMAGA
jgi:hypothetical protein